MKQHELRHQYSDAIVNSTILIVGPIPPPLGGVAVHVKRVAHKLEQQNNRVHIFNTAKKYSHKLSSLWGLLQSIFSIKPNLIYYHEPTESVQKFFFVLLTKYILRYTFVLIDHDCRSLYSYASCKKKFFSWCINQTNHTVVIGDTTDRCYHDNNIKIPKHYSIESPFLPPPIADEETIFSNYPEELKAFITNHTPLLSMNAFAPVLLNGKDLYGLDSSINLMAQLILVHPAIGLIIAIGTIKNSEQKNYFEQLQMLVHQKKLAEHVFFFFGQNECWPIIKRSTLFLRPTLSDGHSLSVQEAVFFNIPVVATNVCLRPAGAELISPNNFSELLQKTKSILTGRCL